MGVAGIIIDSDYGSFPHSLLSTSKNLGIPLEAMGWCLWPVMVNGMTGSHSRLRPLGLPSKENWRLRTAGEDPPWVSILSWDTPSKSWMTMTSTESFGFYWWLGDPLQEPMGWLESAEKMGHLSQPGLPDSIETERTTYTYAYYTHIYIYLSILTLYIHTLYSMSSLSLSV